MDRPKNVHIRYKDYLCHHGILGMKWGIRRFQNKDGTLTDAGKERYQEGSNDLKAIDAIRKPYYVGDRTEYIKSIVADCMPADTGEMYNKFSHGKSEEKKRLRDAADLGLAALKRQGVDVGDEPQTDREKDWQREWFLFEDQTIGMGMIADLINRGYSASDCRKLIYSVHDQYETGELDESRLSVRESGAIFDITEGDWNGSLSSFADACEKERDLLKRR